MILLDTHVLLWVADDAPRLGRRAAKRIDAATSGEGVAVSAVSYWEIATLAERGRLRLRGTVEDLRARALSNAIGEVPLDGQIAILAAKLRGVHGDPADRMIAATALEQDALLVTADATLLAWRSGKTLDATR